MRLGLRTIQPCCAAMLAAAFIFSGMATAQQRPDAGTILQTVPPPREPSRPAGEVPLPPAPKPSMRPPSNIKVMVSSVRFTGNTLFSDAELQKAVAGFLNKQLTNEDLDELLRAVSTVYRSAGYFLAQAYFPRQELTAGSVEVYVLEGKIGKVSLEREPGAQVRQFVARGYLSNIKEGEVATEKNIERPLLLLQDLPSTTVKSSVGPGAKPGEADLKVQVGDDGRRISGIGEVQNFGNKFAGAIQAGAQVFLSNPTGLGDLVTLRGLVSEHNLTQVLGGSYAVPVGPLGTKAGVSYSELRYKLGGDLSSSLASGDAQITTLLLIHPFIRTRDSNLFGQINADQKDLEDRVGSIASQENRRIKDARIGVFGDSRDFLLGGGLNAYSATYTKGKLTILTPTTLAVDQTPGVGGFTNGNFQKFNAELRRAQQVTKNLVFAVNVNLQRADANLASVEKVSAGGPQNVRAYAVGEALADDALMLNAELRYRAPGWKVFSGDVQLVGFLDGAKVNRFHNQPASDVGANGVLLPNQRNLYGAGIGLRIGAENNFALVADLAWRVGSDASQSDVDRSPRVWLHAIKYF